MSVELMSHRTYQRVEWDRGEGDFPHDQLMNNVDARAQDVLAGSNFASSVWTKLTTGNGILSFTRDICSAIPSVGPKDIEMSRLGIVTNGIGVLTHGRNLYNGVRKLTEYNQIGDTQGATLAKTQIGSSGTLFSASAFSLTGLVFEAEHWGAQVASITGLIGSALSGVGSVIGMGVAGYRLQGLSKFRNKLNAHFHHPQVDSAVEKARQTLAMLKGMLSVSEEEAAQMASEIETEYPNYTHVEKEYLFNLACKDLTKVRINEMKRCCGMKSIKMIVSQAETLLEKLGDVETQDEAIQDTACIVAAVKSANMKKIALFTTVFIASVLTFAAFIAGTFFTAGSLPLILMAISALIALVAMATHWVAEKLPLLN